MFPLSVLRRTRPLICPPMQITAPRYGASHLACWSDLPLVQKRQQHAIKRSFFNLTSKVPPPRTGFCRLCTSAANASGPGNLIYSGTLGKAIIGVKMFSYTSSLVSLCMMPHILLNTPLATQSLVTQACFCSFIGFFTFLTPVLLHLVTRGYVLRLYHRPDGDAYTAVTVSVLLTEKRTVFRQEEVKVPAASRMFTSFYVAGGTGLLVNPDLFQLPGDYNHLMGYDRPFSFQQDDLEKLDDLEKPDKG